MQKNNKSKILNIIHEPNPILRRKSSEIDTINKGIKKFSDQLYETMIFYNGVGLAAIQTGYPKKIIALNTEILNQQSYKKITDRIIINAKIIYHSNDTFTFNEGCISFGTIETTTQRYKNIEIEYNNIKGQHKKMYIKPSLLSVCLQHEIDHTNGILFYDRINNNYIKNRFYKEYIKNRHLYIEEQKHNVFKK